jgi:hypothetical protein
VYHTTGFIYDEICDITDRIEWFAKEAGQKIDYPFEIGLFTSVMVTLRYLHRNIRQVELAEYHECSQPTISRAITALTPWIEKTFREYVPTAEDLSPDEQYIVDGTLVPCWSWANRPELYSGKHKTTGDNLQIVCDLYGKLRWVSDPISGKRHDSAALDLSNVLEGMNPANWIGDKGYVGKGMITPYKKPQGGELADWQKKFNKEVNKIRWIVERTIANLKTWRILHIDYRRPYKTFATTISAVFGLVFFKQNA